MSKKYDVVVSEKYQDRDGNEKTRYINIGAVFETQKGLSIKLESLPIGWNGWASFYEPKPKDGQQRQQTRSQSREPSGGHSSFAGDDVPFAPIGSGRSFLAM